MHFLHFLQQMFNIRIIKLLIKVKNAKYILFFINMFIMRDFKIKMTETRIVDVGYLFLKFWRQFMAKQGLLIIYVFK
jgi:hypothetical protein